MEKLFALIGILFDILIMFWLGKIIIRFFKNQVINNKKQNVDTYTYFSKPNLPYRKKPYFLSNNERNFLYTIEKITENKFYIFPQVHYCKIIYADGQQNFKNPWFNKISGKSADFVLFDKATVSPILVIEIDDSSHQRQDRTERDDFINDVLEKCRIPVIHVPPYINEEELKKQIAKKI